MESKTIITGTLCACSAVLCTYYLYHNYHNSSDANQSETTSNDARNDDSENNFVAAEYVERTLSLKSGIVPPRISISAFGVLINYEDGILSFCEESLLLLKEVFLLVSDLYIIAEVHNQLEEDQVYNLFNQHALFASSTSKTMMKEKLLFSSMEMGRSHMVRQLSPHLHIDDSNEVVSSLVNHIPELVCIKHSAVMLDSEEFKGCPDSVYLEESLSSCFVQQ
eukprot:TRINITY_DN7702_c0_g1_i1.p1 TRINITY_DN7702_c0_g1~~TRINITY_DN7702_c0_g1_i1.p1  ORF type:complete len:222 (+),score=34.00 TRINITY_DN7702_c0_g1_i1:816-1481(+)